MLSGLDEANPEMKKLVGNSKGPRHEFLKSVSELDGHGAFGHFVQS